MHMSVWVCATCGCPWRPETLDTLDLKLQVFVSFMKCVLGNELRYYVKVICALNHWTVFPVPHHFLMSVCFFLCVCLCVCVHIQVIVPACLRSWFSPSALTVVGSGYQFVLQAFYLLSHPATSDILYYLFRNKYFFSYFICT